MRRQARRDVLCEVQSVLDALRRNARFATVSQSIVISEVSFCFFCRRSVPRTAVRGDDDHLCACHLARLRDRAHAQALGYLERMTKV